jgi:tRNA threonylcarbamoyladenosine biosynthesis protein TsaB
MKLLAIETATEACSVALLVDGEMRERFEVAPRRHTDLVLPWADELLAEAGLARTQLDAIAVGRGPGAFTGVRLAVALAQGMALALDLPVLPVSTLAALAWPARRTDGSVLAAIDARMGEVYLGWFRAEGQGLHAIGPEWMAVPSKVDIDAASLVGVGTGFAAAEGALAEALMTRLVACDPVALPRASDLARLAALDFAAGRAIAPDQLEPAYLRDKVALTLAEQGKTKSGDRLAPAAAPNKD